MFRRRENLKSIERTTEVCSTLEEVEIHSLGILRKKNKKILRDDKRKKRYRYWKSRGEWRERHINQEKNYSFFQFPTSNPNKGHIITVHIILFSLGLLKEKTY